MSGIVQGEVHLAFFNPLRPSFIEDPYPALARLREAAPLYRSAELDSWVVTSYDLASQVLRDDARFTADPSRARNALAGHFALQAQRSGLSGVARMNSSDRPDHSRLRTAANPHFTRAVLRSRAGRITERARALLERRTATPSFDIVTDFAVPLARSVAWDHLGVHDPDEQEAVHRWATAVRRLETAPDAPAAEREAGAEALASLRAYLDARGADADRGDAPALQLLTAGGDLSDEERLGVVVDLGLSGNGSVAGAIANGALALLRHPEEEAALRAHPELLEGAVEEVLRYDAPTAVLGRWATADVDFAETSMRAGDEVLVVVAAAHRDPAVFVEPDRFDVRRDGPPHLAFGLGTHHCAGAGLGRLEIAVALRELLAAFPVLRAAPEAPRTPPRARNWMMRQITSLPIEVGAGSAAG
ncbi:MAG: cytochrome P450 [Dehalococcoidia bacterium]|nr:cytochrome P450 [Dehalococcoidia bacterium]